VALSGLPPDRPRVVCGVMVQEAGRAFVVDSDGFNYLDRASRGLLKINFAAGRTDQLFAAALHALVAEIRPALIPGLNPQVRGSQGADGDDNGGPGVCG
jgi:hypothetical protein